MADRAHFAREFVARAKQLRLRIAAAFAGAGELDRDK
jgi:hypothetical protein